MLTGGGLTSRFVTTFSKKFEAKGGLLKLMVNYGGLLVDYRIL